MLALLAMCGATMTVACTPEEKEEIKPEPTPEEVKPSIPVKFSVSATEEVLFASGNLQYCAATQKWRFAEHQYDYLGDVNANVSATNEGWIDLFGWGTSGWESGATEYQPWAVSTTSTDYNPGQSLSTDLAGSCANADWAWFNQIENGGSGTAKWRTLTKNEWNYLLNERYGAHAKRGVATIDGTYRGLVILPDSCHLAHGITLDSNMYGWNTNRYTMAQWKSMEDSGAVFLPAAGRRLNTTVSEVGTSGCYWTATHYDNYSAHCVVFSRGYEENESYVAPTNTENRSYAFAVRPVCRYIPELE